MARRPRRARRTEPRGPGQLSSYEHRKQFLGRDDFDYGQFGENFTVEGLPDDDVCIGDQYQIGQALFEVSQPRVTCSGWDCGWQSPGFRRCLCLIVAQGSTSRCCSDFLSSLSIPVDALAYLCGPVAFMDDVRAALTKTGLGPATSTARCSETRRV